MIVAVALGSVCGIRPLIGQELGWVGCYSLERTAWTWTRADMDSAQHLPPDRVELHEDSIGTVRNTVYRRVTPSIQSYERARGQWFQDTPDSLFIAWSSGYTGVFLHLATGSDSLVGTMRAFTDHHLVDVHPPTAHVRLVPVPCAESGGGERIGNVPRSDLVDTDRRVGFEAPHWPRYLLVGVPTKPRLLTQL